MPFEWTPVCSCSYLQNLFQCLSHSEDCDLLQLKHWKTKQHCKQFSPRSFVRIVFLQSFIYLFLFFCFVFVPYSIGGLHSFIFVFIFLFKSELEKKLIEWLQQKWEVLLCLPLFENTCHINCFNFRFLELRFLHTMCHTGNFKLR